MKNSKNKVEEFIRVDHAGERGAVKIYEGQLLALNTLVKDESLKKMWKEELDQMRLHMLNLRKKLAQSLASETKSDRFNFVERHRGMFSKLGLTESQVETLREENGIYMVSDSRINIAGLRHEIIGSLAQSIAKVI